MKTLLFIISILAVSTPSLFAQSPEPFNNESHRIPAHILDQHTGQAELNVQSDESPSDDFISSSYPSGSPALMAPPANNGCGTAIALTVNAPCINGTTKEGTVQTGENYACQGTPTQTVWYKFVATATSMYVEIEWLASSGCYFSSAVYSGGCLPANATALSCEDAAGGPLLNIHNLTGLTVGNTYLIQVSYTGGGPCGATNGGQAVNTGADFCIKVGVPVLCNTCNNTCGSMCIFPSAPTVAQVTSNCTQYQLQSRLNAGQTRTMCYTFTALATSFSLQMIINTVGCSGGNVTSFNWNLYPANCSGVVQSGTLANLNATGLTIGAGYVLCYTWTAACQQNSVYPYMIATSPLPVEIAYFNGNNQNNVIELKWVTAAEINNNYFSLQRSSNGIEFEEIGVIKGAGNSNNPIEYSFLDIFPEPGINYYRLVQYDYDNSSRISETIAIRHKESFATAILNSVVNDDLQMNITAESEGVLEIKAISPDGRTILTERVVCSAGLNTIKLNVSGFASGIYHIRISGFETIQSSRIVKI